MFIDITSSRKEGCTSTGHCYFPSRPVQGHPRFRVVFPSLLLVVVRAGISPLSLRKRGENLPPTRRVARFPGILAFQSALADHTVIPTQPPHLRKGDNNRRGSYFDDVYRAAAWSLPVIGEATSACIAVFAIVGQLGSSWDLYVCLHRNIFSSKVRLKNVQQYTKSYHTEKAR